MGPSWQMYWPSSKEETGEQWCGSIAESPGEGISR